MNAVRKLHDFRDALYDDVLHGAPISTLTLESNECCAFLDEVSEEPSAKAAFHLCEAISELWARGREKQLNRFDVLVRRLMEGTMTADELLEWRDMQRAELIDYASKWARKEMEERDRAPLPAEPRDVDGPYEAWKHEQLVG